MDVDVEEFMCPISMCMMEDPVIVAETGISYERKEITAWFSEGKITCPCTGVELKNRTLVPNRALKAAIEKWKEQNEKHETPEEKQEECLTSQPKKSKKPWIEWLCPCLKAEVTVVRECPRVPQCRPAPRHVANKMTASVRNRSIDGLHAINAHCWKFDSLDDSGRSPLHVAAIQNDAYFVDALIRYNASPDFRDKMGCTALHWASRLGHVDCMECLLRSGAKPNAPNNSRATPVHMAAFWGRLPALKMLIDYGGDIRLLNERHQRPIDVARESPWDSAKQAIEMLREYERSSRRLLVDG